MKIRLWLAHHFPKPGINYFDRIPIRNKLIIFFLLLSLVPILIIGSLSFVSSRKAMVEKIKEYSLKESTQTVGYMQFKLNEFENIAVQLHLNKEFNDAVSNYIINSDSAPHAVQSITAFYNNYMINYPDIFAFMLVSDSPSPTPVIVCKDYKEELLAFSTQLKTTDFYRSLRTVGGGLAWGPPAKIDGENFLFLARRLTSRETGEQLGVLMLIVDEEKVDYVLNSSIYRDLSLSLDNIPQYSVVIDSQGTIISTPYKPEIGENIAQYLENMEPLTRLLSGEVSDRDYGSEINQGTFITLLQQEPVLITYQSIASKVGIGGKSGWNLLNITLLSYLYAEANTVGYTTLFIGVIFVVLAVYISFLVSSSISKPLNEVVTAMTQAEEGVISVRVGIKTHNELGRLSASFNQMLEKIGILIVDTKQTINSLLQRSAGLEESSNQSARTAESVAAAMGDITHGAMEQTNEAEKSVQQMQDLAKQIEKVVQAASELEEITTLTRNLGFSSKEAVKLLIEKSSETDQITKMIMEDINELQVGAAEIGKVTDLISNLAEQSNLLALNAAIEAARAGKMGHGFAVVAEEVNKLALQSREAAKTINSILQSIQHKTQVSSEIATQVHQIVQEQREAVASAQGSFDGIITAMENAVNKITDVNGQIKTINDLKEETVRAIVNISAISEENSASAEEVSASTQEQTSGAEQVKRMAEELRRMAETLVESITKFKVEDEV